MLNLRKTFTHSFIVLVALSSVACSTVKSIEVKPWVKPYERFNLADPIMQFDRNPVASSFVQHVYQAREGGRGAEGGSGGGCGCN